MEIPENELHTYLSLNPKNAEEMLNGMTKQISLMMKHVEMLKEELMRSGTAT